LDLIAGADRQRRTSHFRRPALRGRKMLMGS